MRAPHDHALALRKAPTLRQRPLCVVLWLILASPVLSATFTHSTPGGRNGAFSAANGLNTTLSYDPIEQYGYQPVTLTVNAAKPAASDRQLTVRLYIDRGFLGEFTRYDQAVEQDAELAAGVTSVQLEIMAPRLHDWGMLRWVVWVDGVRDAQLTGVTPQQNSGGQRALTLLHPGGSWNRASIFDPSNLFSGRYAGAGPNGFVTEETSPLPHDWRALERYSAVVLTVDQLSSQRRTNPAGVAALLRWVALGGRLVVEQVGDRFERIARVDEFVDQSQQPLDRELARQQQDEVLVAQGDEEDVAEAPPEPPPFADSPTWRWASVALPWDPTDGPQVEPEGGEGQRQRRRVSADGWFLECPIGFGEVVAFPARISEPPRRDSASDRLQGFAQLDNRSLQRAAFRYLAQRDWTERHGLAPDRGNEEFSNWLVPGVGAAPIDAFRWLITLFVVLVGPASFFVLRAYQRTQLLALTAPLAAAAFTLGLFAYATLSDGVGLRVRARSLTYLDQQSGRAVSWSRQSYYAGLAPAEGLRFPKSAAVYPVMAAWDAQEIDSSRPLMRELVVSDAAEQLRRGWLSSRQTTQLLVLDASDTGARLSVTHNGERLTARNELGVEVDRLYVLDHDEQWWSAAGVAAGEQTPLVRDDRAGVVASARQAFQDAAPQHPVGVDGSSWRRPTSLLGERRRSGRGDRVSSVSLAEGRLEQLLLQLEGRGDGLTAPLRPGSYLAISEQAACAPIGHPDARELGGFHVTLGVWEASRP